MAVEFVIWEEVRYGSATIALVLSLATEVKWFSRFFTPTEFCKKYAVEVWGTIPSVDDYAIIYNGKVPDMETMIFWLVSCWCFPCWKDLPLESPEVEGWWCPKDPEAEAGGAREEVQVYEGQLGFHHYWCWCFSVGQWMLNFSISVVMLFPNFKPKPHTSHSWGFGAQKGARGTRITHDAIWKTSKFIEITCRRWKRRVSRSPRHASASATFWLGCLGGSLPSSFRVRVCFGLLLSSFSRERPSAEQAVGSGKQCLACTWQAATGPALGGWSSGANSSHGGSLRAIFVVAHQ